MCFTPSSLLPEQPQSSPAPELWLLQSSELRVMLSWQPCSGWGAGDAPLLHDAAGILREFRMPMTLLGKPRACQGCPSLLNQKILHSQAAKNHPRAAATLTTFSHALAYLSLCLSWGFMLELSETILYLWKCVENVSSLWCRNGPCWGSLNFPCLPRLAADISVDNLSPS